MLAGKKPIVACQGDVAASGDRCPPYLCFLFKCLPIMPKEKSGNELVTKNVHKKVTQRWSCQHAGGFYMAMGCPIIVAQPLTITGLKSYAVFYSIYFCYLLPRLL